MTNQEILEKAIQKAIDGGWMPLKTTRPVVGWGADYSDAFDEGEGVLIRALHARSNADYSFYSLRELIYNHDFAKALWGTEIEDPTDWPNEQQQEWQYQLKEMVIADDPIKYLGENI